MNEGQKLERERPIQNPGAEGLPRHSGRGGARADNRGRFDNDRERAREAGRKGGRVSGGNFKHDPERAREAGRKGGSR